VFFFRTWTPDCHHLVHTSSSSAKFFFSMFSNIKSTVYHVPELALCIHRCRVILFSPKIEQHLHATNLQVVTGGCHLHSFQRETILVLAAWEADIFRTSVWVCNLSSCYRLFENWCWVMFSGLEYPHMQDCFCSVIVYFGSALLRAYLSNLRDGTRCRSKHDDINGLEALKLSAHATSYDSVVLMSINLFYTE
jgi:hypothetical protein